MTDSPGAPESALTEPQRRAVESIVGAAMVDAAVVWQRPHVMRVSLADGRTAIVKRPRDDSTEMIERFESERSNLAYLSALEEPVVPSFLGADEQSRLLVMEDLPPGRSLAHSLLGDRKARAERDLISFGAALGRLHRWSFYHPAPNEVRWPSVARDGLPALMQVFEARGIAVTPTFTAECDEIITEVADGGPWRGFVHGDPCPDNTQVIGDRFVFFDFEHSGAGSVLLDAGYLLAPFPTCWCFAPLPSATADAAMAAYREEVGNRPGFERALAAAMATWVLARGQVIASALAEERQWGTTGMRPRLLQWLSACGTAATTADCFPALVAVFGALHVSLLEEWPGPRLAYPALKQGGETAIAAPDWWPLA